MKKIEQLEDRISKIFMGNGEEHRLFKERRDLLNSNNQGESIKKEIIDLLKKRLLESESILENTYKSFEEILDSKEDWEIEIIVNPVIPKEVNKFGECLCSLYRENYAEIYFSKTKENEYKADLESALLFLEEVNMFSKSDINSITDFELTTHITY